MMISDQQQRLLDQLANYAARKSTEELITERETANTKLEEKWSNYQFAWLDAILTELAKHGQ